MTVDSKCAVKKLLRSSIVWLFLGPWTIWSAGVLSNQAVLISNSDKFPVMLNAREISKVLGPKSSPIDILFGAILPEVKATEKPVDPDGMLDSTHCVMTSKTHLNFLADIFDFHSATYSVGDGLLALGDWLNTFCPWVALALLFKKAWDADAI